MNKNKEYTKQEIISFIKLKLTSMGTPVEFPEGIDEAEEHKQAEQVIHLSKNIIESFQEKSRLLSERLNPIDQRIQDFLNDYFKDIKKDKNIELPHSTFTLDFKGIAREASIPLGKNKFSNEFIKSYRIKQGVLHNPKHDKRTTKGTFHIVEGGPPVPIDKIEMPKVTFAGFLEVALNPPKELMCLPFTQTADKRVETFVSLLLRPIVCPAVENIINEKRMEVRFFTPGSLISNLDFVENIFGNGGDPTLCENDAALDIDHWTGHTGCIILAPHLLGITKKEAGLPHFDNATERQIREGMCYKFETELYNEGSAFKATCRNNDGNVITIIADNYFGYSKKEVKTQISYSANLYGLCEEEHAGGALVFPRRSIQGKFIGELFLKKFDTPYSFEKVKENFSNLMDIQKENYGIDKIHKNIIYIPENATIDIYDGNITWQYEGTRQSLKISPECHYIYPTGHKLKMEKHPFASTWEIISTDPEGTVCHKPCTVSGGGKSEISKSILNAINYGPFYVNDIEEDFDAVDKLIVHDYSNRWKCNERKDAPSRSFLSSKRTLGSVVKLLTPSSKYSKEYNKFLESVPFQVKSLAFFVKMFFRKDRHSDWRNYITVNKVNGKKGHELLFNKRKIMSSYLRVGFSSDKSWNMHTLRPDFIASSKIQLEDDISATITIPSTNLKTINPVRLDKKSVKIVANCEGSFFQRPDEAVNRGYDKDAEQDMATDGIFVTNYEPLTKEGAKRIMEEAIEFDSYTNPMKELITDFYQSSGEYFVSSAHPRIVDGKPTKNPRYLQRKDMFYKPIDTHLAEVGIRFYDNITYDSPLYFPVDAVLPSRRNNPRDKEAGIRSLSVFNPIHYQELPELFMDFICSLTGKSPSTTGAGSEGALTKGPFNMLSATTDLNNALLSYILTEYDGFSSAAGFIGAKKFDHDVSILIPEIWSRLKPKYRSATRMIEKGELEKIEDFDHNGERILAGRLGYRITEAFLVNHVNRIFDEPQLIFTKDVLRPELQSMDDFADGINNILEAQKKVASNYFMDGSIEQAIPPLKALLHIMANGNFEGKTIEDKSIRDMFKRDYVINSDWYKKRLVNKQKKDISIYNKQIDSLKHFIKDDINQTIVTKKNLEQRLILAEDELNGVKSAEYLTSLAGTIGLDLAHN